MVEEASSFTAGYRLDRYELLCPIASGGMASVWLARLLGKRGFEKLVAIKTIRTELLRDARYQEMFLDEARIASGIVHPNVAHILDLGEQDNTLYIVMEWVDGESLSRIATLTQSRGMMMPIELSLRIMADVCAGLHAAHELRDPRGGSLNVVHRDVSPQNILVTIAGGVKVIDFGIAKARRRSAGETQAGVLKGKIRYMAPEQINGDTIDRRADIWAVGMCLRELITGREPYHELDDLAVMRTLMGKDPAPRFDEAELPGPIRAIFQRSLAANMNRRFEDAASMRRALENALVELGLTATTEDVADFVRTNFADLAQHRRDTIAKAVAAADERSGPMSGVAAPRAQPEEVALAPTQVVSLTSGDSKVRAPSTTGGATLRDQLDPRPPPRRAAIIVVVALAVVGIGLLVGGRMRKTDSLTTEPSGTANAASASAAPRPSENPPPPATTTAAAAPTTTPAAPAATAAPATAPSPEPKVATSAVVAAPTTATRFPRAHDKTLDAANAAPAETAKPQESAHSEETPAPAPKASESATPPTDEP